jgi:hypothetical protein
MHIVFALFLFAHGVAHLVGFSAAWALSPAKIPHLTTVIGGRFDVGESGIRVVGLLWVAAAVAFAVVAVGAALATPWWPSALIVVALGSLALCVLGWPEAKIGVMLNLGILVLAAMIVGWFPVAP